MIDYELLHRVRAAELMRAAEEHRLARTARRRRKRRRPRPGAA
ncbi:hypothetical protein [Streptomyces litchfieldiae]|uniref:Uncharacterized protein n=1 Tax=Streptomyces litchfieldiae TaxID=3075543 RepID=A0ABU2MI96_9ACTN|nr:hypothetical protein [Streptomyces sp. DSM 44938]MDT0341230.1 hypothetical protein [Streptomyces sp. DSM 44938]